MDTKTYRLASSGFVSAPGLIRWAINGYHFKKDRAALMRIITETWQLPRPAAKALLSEQVPFTVLHGDTVAFTITEETKS